MSRYRKAAYRVRRQQRHAGRHTWIDEPLPDGGYRLTEYRRGRVVSVEICPGMCVSDGRP